MVGASAQGGHRGVRATAGASRAGEEPPDLLAAPLEVRVDAGERVVVVPVDGLDEIREELRLEEAEKAAAIAGVDLRVYDWGDYPMRIDDDSKLEMVRLLRELRPDVVLTHGRKDPNNPDHVATASLVEGAAIWARAHGRLPELARTVVPEIYGFEPEFPEFCDFRADTYLDISDVAEQKLEMMRCSSVQDFMIETYEQRARYRAIMAGLILRKPVTHAEAYESFLPRAGELFS